MRASGRMGSVLLVLVSALMWGLWWVPVRLCEALGLSGVWPNLGINLGAFLALGAIVLFGPSSSKLSKMALLGSLLVGMAVALYGAALSLTEVARAVLLFYLAPAWSTLIEVVFLGRRWTVRRLPPLALSFIGMIIIFQGEISLAGGGAGDLAALASGLFWSAGAALVFSTEKPERQSAPRLGLAVMVAAVVTSILLLPLGWEGMPSLGHGDIDLAILLAFGAGAVYLAPIIGVTLWGAKHLPPATISFLLAAEILSGISSSALFLDEPFGAWKVAGTVLIIGSIMAHILLTEERAKAVA